MRVIWQLHKEALAAAIKALPSYYIRQKDGLSLPPLNDYYKAFDKLMSCNITSTAVTAVNCSPQPHRLEKS